MALFHTIGRSSIPSTIADETLALSALIFLLCTHTIFISLRTKNRAFAARIETFIDIMFALALTGMVAAGFIMVYTIW